ncbi:MAG TPA: rRNA adenine N-6-methyltransferase family protein, partial [Spirochaetota bacterium]|nr:rRNA adenine N-6-methyltransferase family protein [Spirochaetota bacterium]
MTARHGLGQNFLVSRHILERIVATAAVQPGEDVLEIGPGLGFLTHFLLSAGARVRAYETDAALCDWLAGVFHGVPAF